MSIPSPDQTTDSTLGFYNRTECIAMNLAFARAMLAARDRGEEHFTIGPKVDDTPLVGAYFDKPLRHSPMSSSANACLNMTLDTSRPAPLTAITGTPRGSR
jgi:hypothetical protein